MSHATSFEHSKGGLCVGPDQCVCKTGWTGSSCQKPVCTKKCENGGKCITPEKCSCKVPFSGDYCESIQAWN